jgi:hypothetical protein
LNIGVSRNRFCDFLADPDSRSFSRFGAIIMQFAVLNMVMFPRQARDKHRESSTQNKREIYALLSFLPIRNVSDLASFTSIGSSK